MKIKNGFYLWCITGLFAILPMVSFAQTNKVKGTVTDASTGEALIGASVLVKGTSNGTITDMDGNFVLDLSGQKTLVVSFVGYLSKEVRVAGGTNPIIMLEPDSKVGDRIRVYIKNQVEGWQQGSFKKGSDWSGLTDELGVVGLSTEDFDKGYYEMTIDDVTLPLLQSYGLIISGCNYTAVRVVLILVR